MNINDMIEQFENIDQTSMINQAADELAREIFIMMLRDNIEPKQAARMAFHAADAFFDRYKVRNEIV